jgi:hypothetical protein
MRPLGDLATIVGGEFGLDEVERVVGQRAEIPDFAAPPLILGLPIQLEDHIHGR